MCKYLILYIIVLIRKITMDNHNKLTAYGGDIQRRPQRRKETIQDRVDILLDELNLAIHWQRPSILFLIFDSDLIRLKVEATLKHRLSEIKQVVHHLSINEYNYDISDIISQYPDYRNAVFFLSGLKWGGGRKGFAAYHALNLAREFFVENQIRAAFWLTKIEARDLPRQAPDFWAFRHRVIEFNNMPFRGRIYPSIETLYWENLKPDLSDNDIDAKIILREASLKNLPEVPESVAVREGIIYELAHLNWTRKDYVKSIEFLNKGLTLAVQLQDTLLQSRYWVGLGNIFQMQNHHAEAISAFKKAIEFNPKNIIAWSNLAVVYRNHRQARKAILVSNKAIEINPRVPEPWNNLANAYRDLGRFEDALMAYQSAIKLEKTNSKYYNNLGSTFRDIDRNKEALRIFLRGIKSNPLNPTTWKNLGELYLSVGRVREAINAFKKETTLDPNDVHSFILLANCYRKLNMKKRYHENIRVLLTKIHQDTEYNRACFEAICGNSKVAIRLLRIALKKGQTQLYLIERDSNLEYLREDPRLKVLLQKEVRT